MKLCITILIGLLGYLFNLGAQDKSTQFWHINSENGLSQNHISCMMQDKDGYIWIGTFFGLNRFNGNDIKVFNKDSNPGSLSANMVTSLFEDKDGYIWVGSISGLDKFDKKTETFSRVKLNTNEKIPENTIIRDILQDKNGDIWFSTFTNGVMKLNVRTNQVKVFCVRNSKNFPSNSIYGLLLQNTKLWVCSDSGLCIISISDGKVIVPEFKGASVKYCFCIAEDKSGNVWVGNQKGELFSINPQNYNVTKISYLPLGVKNEKITISKLARDNLDNMFIATQGAGLIKYNTVTGKTEGYTHNSYNKSSISSNEIFSLLVDKSNTVFAGTYGKGVSVYSYSINKFNPHFLQLDIHGEGDLNSFTSCLELGNNKLLLGCYSGFYILDTLKWTYKYILPGSSYDENKILNIVKAPDGTIWLSTPKYIHRYTSGLNKIASYRFLDNNLDQVVYDLLFDSKNNLWIGYAKNLGVIKIPESEWKSAKGNKCHFKWYKNNPANPRSLKDNMVWSIKQNRDNTIWFGCNGFISKYNEQTDDFYNYKVNGLCKDIEFDKKNNLIVSTAGFGFYLFNPETDQLLNFNEKNGLCRDFLIGAATDKNGNVWFTSENGLAKFTPGTKKIRNYFTNDGLPSNSFEEKAIKKLSNGVFYIGTNNGFVFFNPETIKDDTVRGKVALTNIIILNKPVVYSYFYKNSHSFINAPVGQIKELTLNHKQRADFQFEFSTLHYSAPSEVKYEYTLDGYDNSWIICDAKHRIARYTNIPEGTYYFKVRSSNGDGVWNSDTYSLKITVVPPFYKSSLFLIFFILFCISASYFNYRFRMYLAEKQKKILIKIVEERTAELSYKNQVLEKKTTNLKKANAMLRKHKLSIEKQKEEIAEQRDALSQLNMMKDKFFSIIAHDLKNPFNVIMGFSTLLLHNSKKYDEARKEKIVSLLNQSAISAHLLLENLLNWSRSQSGNLVFEPETLLTSEIVSQAEVQVRDMAKTKNIKIKIENEFENELLMADRNMISTVMRNLISNAIKFSPEKSEIIIKVEKVNARGIILQVIDFGVGMAPDVASNLFIQNGTFSQTGTAGEKGTGLGLVICKEFVDKHKGEITVKSELDKGSTFSVFLPFGNV